MTDSAPRDRRLAKGVIVGAIGLAVLIGGGTFALWSDAIDLPGGTINSGELHLAAEEDDAAWREGPCAGTGETIDDIEAYLISPGDAVCLVQPVTVTVTGSDIAAQFSIDTSAIASDTSSDAALFAALEITASLSDDTGFDPGSLPANTWAVAASETPYEKNVSVEFVFDIDTANQVAQDEQINLGSIAFSLVQTSNDAP